jgi:hypothetical protein
VIVIGSSLLASALAHLCLAHLYQDQVKLLSTALTTGLATESDP